MRTPSYCDRVLCKTPPNFNVECHAYASCDQLTTSDHSPVFGVYSVPLLYPDMHVRPLALAHFVSLVVCACAWCACACAVD
jgi:hypothetical protein